MKMNLTQTKIIGLTMQLDLKARQYNKLCDELEKLKANNIDANDPVLFELKEKFIKNNDEIVKINRQLEKLKQ